jgi:hypothetical protein
MTSANQSSPHWDAKMRGCMGQLAAPKFEVVGCSSFVMGVHDDPPVQKRKWR